MAKVFNITTSKDEKVIGFYNQAIKELEAFYGLDLSKDSPRLLIVPDRKTFNELYNKETENWVVGSTMNSKETLHLLAPESYERESSHKYSDNEYLWLMKHELSHLISQRFYDSYKPIWFTEGIAIYSSGQIEYYGRPKTFTKFLDFFSNGGNGVYDESGAAVEILIKKIGKENFLKALKDIKTPVTKELFEEFFKKNFDIELSYKWFNENL